MIKIKLYKTDIINEREVTIGNGEVRLYQIPSPSISNNYAIEIISIKGVQYYVSFIIYKPKMHVEDTESIVFIALRKLTVDDGKERIFGLVDALENELINMHPTCDNSPLPVFDANNFYIDIPKVPSTNREYIYLAQDLYRINRIVYSEEITCRLFKVDESDVVFSELPSYGSDAAGNFQ